MELVNYVDLVTMKLYAGVDAESLNDGLLQDAISSASREVENRTDRVFSKAETASEREFVCYGSGLLIVDDIADRDGVLIDGEPLSDSHKLFPLNGIVSGQPGHPYEWIKSTQFCEGRTYKVTAIWGWPAVPPTVVEVVKMIAAETYIAKDSPLGVAGDATFGVLRVRERQHIEKKLRQYGKNPVKIV